MTSALLLLLEATVLLTLTLDLAQDFAILPLWSRAGLVLLAAGALPALGRAPRRRVIGRLRAPVALLAAAAVLLGLLGVTQAVAARRIAALWESGARDRLGERARILQEDFSWFLGEMLRPIETIRPENPDAVAAFESLSRALAKSRLPRERLGFSIYREDGSLLAWAGNTEPAPREALSAAGRKTAYRIGVDETARRLYAVAASPQGLRWVGEFLVRPPAPVGWRDEVGAHLDFLPRWGRAGPAHVHLREAQSLSDDLSRFFERQGDRYWGRLGREAVTTLSFPLRAPDGATLAVVTLKDRRADQEVATLRRGFRQVGALLASCAFLLAWLLLARSGRISQAARLAIGTAAIWLGRWALLSVGSAADLPRLAIYDIGLYASPALGGLLRSPADLLLTAVACIAQAWLLNRYVNSLPAPMGAPFRARALRGATAGLAVLLAGGAVGLHALLDRMVLDARLDIKRVQFDAQTLPRFALQVSLFLLVASLALLVVAVFEFALRCREDGWGRHLRGWLQDGPLRRLPLVLRVTGAALILTLFYVPFLTHAYARLRQTFFEDDLLPRVLEQKERRAQVLRDSVAMAGNGEFATLAAFAAEGASGPGSIAYRLWSETPMAEMGLASSLQIFDASGRSLDRFSVNFAPSLEVPFGAASAGAGSEPVEVPPRPHAIVKKTVLAASRWIRAPRRPPLLVVMTVVDDYDNLPLVGADTGYVQMFRARAVPRTNPELLRFDPMVAVFGPHFERLYESGGEIPPPGPLEMHTIDRRGIAWAADNAGEGPARVLYARGPGVIFALAHPRDGLAESLASILRLFLQNGALAALLVTLARAGRRQGSSASPGTTFYGRLTGVFLLTALIPLLALAFFVTRFSAREFARDLTTSGLSSLQVARRVAEDYLAVSNPEEVPSLDDDVVFWMSRVVRQDLSIFREADLLTTSTRELYSSGLLNTRLDGEVYLALYLEREPFRLAAEHAGGLDYLTLSAPMRIDREGTMGVISIPLTGQRRAIERKVQEVEDAVLISTCLTVILLAGVGYLVARRVSEPITLLARAARRVAEGDLDVRVRAAARDEIGILVDAFNRMAASLR
ncbi:MAG TPA: HAMP domain-containing protein, partial [Candidatus Polarisedimenticolia bacterium]|nr:HAMP domain-containing protein [Candidatus Polarisedimenticolia bacterium]